VSAPLPRSKEADVAANREGRITGTQLFDLWYSGLWRLLVGLPIAGVAVALSWGPPMPSIPAANFIFMAFGIGALGYGTYVSWKGFSFIGDALTRKVTYVTGPVGRQEKTGYRGAKYYYMVVGPVKTLLYRRRTYEAVPVGVLCHAYYVPGSGHLLSLEPATAEEPHPSVRFGSDPTHAWDRLRWTWLLVAVAAYGLAAGVYATVTAHPAKTETVSGSISAYKVVHGRNTSRYLYLRGSPEQYSLNGVESASPPVPDLYRFVNLKADLYVNADDGVDILALRIHRDCVCSGIPNTRPLYAGDLYLHPEHQYWGMIWSGAPIAVLSGLLFAFFCWAIVHMRRHPASEMSDVATRAHEAMHT
jgi:hypothetical protein